MKRFFYALMIVALAVVTSCGNKGGNAPALTVNFTISANPGTVGEELTFTAEVTGGVAPYTFAWKVGEDVTLNGSPAAWTPEENGNFVVTLTVTDANGTVANRSKNLAVQAAAIVATGEVNLIWNCQLEGYTSITTPAIADDGNIYTATRDKNHFYKISPAGEIVWTKELVAAGGGNIFGTPSIDTDGTIYMPGGATGGGAVLVAYKPDGTEKWRFTDFWNKGNAHSAKIEGGSVAGIGENNVYIGNTGSTGSVLSVSKADGTRVNHIQGTDGGGPAGGLRGGVVVSKNGYIGWCGGAYGVFTAKTAGGIDETGDAGVMWANRACHSAASGWSMGNNQATLAAMTCNGHELLLGMQAIKDNSTSAYIYTKVYGVDFITGEEVVNCKIDEDLVADEKNCAAQDQGGISVTADGLIIVTLKYRVGEDNGGIALVDPAQNKMVAHFGIAENVTSAAAVDQAGNIHFGTEAGNYYVVKYLGNGQFETLVKKDIAELVKADERYAATYTGTEVVKLWSGIVIGDDGKIYIQYTDNDNRALGGLACITVDYTTGPSTTSPWPMMGQNRKHTNVQK